MRPRTALTIAGSDPSGGAGIQADLKTFVDHGVYGMSVLTALTAQNTRGVSAIHTPPREFLRAQLDAVFADMPVDAIKIGMLGDAGIIHTVAHFLRDLPARPPIVLDPVMFAKGGHPLLDPAAIGALKAELVPLASLVTPNLPEAEELGEIQDVPLLLKGGHADEAEVEDRLHIPGAGTYTYRHPRVDSVNTHGTGCTLSSAIAARLALGHTLQEACQGGVAYVAHLIRASVDGGLGHGHGPLRHGLGDR